MGFQALANQRANLPDSTGDQPQVSIQDEGHTVPLSGRQDQNNSNANANPIHSQVVQHQDPLQESDEVLCAVCQTGGELLGCHKCTKVFHLPCHVPTLHKVPRQALSGSIYLLLISDDPL